MANEILSEIEGHVGIVRLNRPEVLNALSLELMKKLVAQLEAYDSDPNIYVILLSGSEKVWAAGADITKVVSQGAAGFSPHDLPRN